MKTTSSDYTLLGFSKNHFSCCSSHKECQLGKLDCAIEDKDPEAKDYCNCYHRNHHSNRVVKPIKKVTQEDFFLPIEDDGQLSMF